MVMSDHSRAARARLTMRGNQNRRVDFEMDRRIGGDIGGGPYRRNPPRPPQQQAANLVLLSRRQRDDAAQQRP